MIKIAELSNKIRIVTRELKDRDSASLGIWVGVGGRYEDDRMKGVAHFIEHVAFKGSRKYACDAIKEQIEGVGGALNAFTSEEETCYFAKVPQAYLMPTFDILADITFFPLVKARDLEKERGVIVEEIKMYHDLPQYYVMELLEGLLWPGHPLGKNLTGTVASVSGISRTDLVRFHKTHYAPNKVVIAACGRLNHDALVAAVGKKLKHLEGHCGVEFIRAGNRQDAPRVHFHRKDTEQMHVALGALGLPILHKDVYTLSLLNIILGGNMSSRLFNEVREKRGLAYSISSGAKSMSDTGIFLIRAGVDNGKLVATVDLVLRVLARIHRQAVGTDELQRAKDYFLGQFTLALEDTLDHMLWIGETVMVQNQVRTPDEVIKCIRKVSADDIRRVAGELLTAVRLNLAVVGPLKDAQEAELKALMGL